MKTPPDVVVEIDPFNGACTQRHGYAGRKVPITQATGKSCSAYGIEGGVVNLPSDGLWIPIVTNYDPGMLADPTRIWGRVACSTHY